MFCGSFESVSKCCLDRFVALNLWEIYIFNLGHWDFAFKLFLSTPQEILEVSGAIEFYCEKKLTLCLSCYWCSTGQRYIYTGSHDCCVYIFDLVISFPVLHFCSTFHCIIILTVYFNARLFYWGLCSIYIWLKVFRLLPIIESDSSSQLCCLKSIQELENFEYGLFCSLRAPWYSSEGGTLESWI